MLKNKKKTTIALSILLIAGLAGFAGLHYSHSPSHSPKATAHDIITSAHAQDHGAPKHHKDKHHHKHGHHNIKASDKFTISDVVPGIKLLENPMGGNIAVSYGDQGLFIIDSEVAVLEKDLLATIQSIAHDAMKTSMKNGEKGETHKKPVRLLLNTHWHYDHTGGNKILAEKGAVIMAHENVRNRMKDRQVIEAFNKEIPPADINALPVITYQQGPNLHLNGQSAKVITVPPAHTDGDSYVYWPELNVIHTGDLFFNGLYPFIDSSSGGKIDGVIAAAEGILELVDDQTKIIPGHGPLANKTDLQAYIAMLKDIAASAHKAKDAGKSLEDWKKTNPLAAYSENWGGKFLSDDVFASVVWSVL